MEEKQAYEVLTAEYKNRALRTLIIQYDHLLDLGGFQQNNLTRPHIDFIPLKGAWGLWDPKDRAIYLNERLLTEAPWAAVEGIFAHETAHFIVDEVFRPMGIFSDTDAPHGSTFKMVCSFLKMDAFFIRAAVDLDEYGGAPPSPFGKRREEAIEHPILAKVKKLLALASSAATHESAAALSAAERLLTSHNLEMPEEGEEKKSPFERWRIPLGRTVTYRHTSISKILIDYFYVNTIFTYEFNVAENNVTRFLEIIGKPVNLAMAEYVYGFLMERCDALWEAYKPQARAMGEKGLSAKNSFIYSLLRGFAQKLKNEKELSERNGRGEKIVKDASLVLSLKKERDDFLKKCYPNLGYRPLNSVGGNSPRSAKAGFKEGERLTIHTPVGNKSSTGPQGRLPRGN